MAAPRRTPRWRATTGGGSGDSPCSMSRSDRGGGGAAGPAPPPTRGGPPAGGGGGGPPPFSLGGGGGGAPRLGACGVAPDPPQLMRWDDLGRDRPGPRRARRESRRVAYGRC